MRKILTTLILLLTVAFLSFGQDVKPIDPINFKALQSPSFSYYMTNESVWIYKGATYGWTEFQNRRDTLKLYAGKNISLVQDYPNHGVTYSVKDSLVGIDFIDFTQQQKPIHGAYRLFADTVAHTLGFYNDEADITMQIGSEMWSRVYNNSGSNKLNGTVVRITGSEGDIPTINLASNDYHVTADGVLGVATHDIETNTYGFITTIGEVHGLNTSSCPEGSILYLGVNGSYTHIRPLAPNFVVEIGTCLFSDAVDGTILVNIKGSPYDIVHNSFNDIFLESMKFTVTSNGTTTIGSIQRNGGGDLTMQFSSGFSTLDCTPAATVTLTAGTATIPQTNYVYVPKSSGVLTASTSGWPSEEHIKVSEVACRTSALTQADGVLRNQNWNDHIAAANGSGHISHINERIRRLNADWYSGVAPTLTIVSAANPDNVYFSNTGGKVYQMHQQDFPAQAMPTDDIHVVNHFTTPYSTTTNLNTQLTDALGATLVSKSYSLVIWGIQNESGELSHLMVNLPIGSYLSATNAIKDADNYSVYTIPNQFKGVGFLIARITLSHNPSNSGTWTLEQIQDLRGYFPNNTAGSGSSGSGGGVTTYLGLLDTPNTYASSANKLQGVNSGETAIESKAMTVTLAGTANIPSGQQYQINGGSIVVDAINDAVTTTAPSQNAVFDALALKENISNKENTTVDNSTTKYPTVNLLKTYADTKDPSVTNEGQLSTVGTANNATIQSNTSGSNILNIKGAGINIASASGNNITITGTEVDGSITNEIQDLSLSGNILTLSGDATTVDVSQATAVVANTAKVTNATHTGDATGATELTLKTVNSNIGTYNNVTINAKGLATAGSNVAYLTSEIDGSVSNEGSLTATDKTTYSKNIHSNTSGSTDVVMRVDSIIPALLISRLNNKITLKADTTVLMKKSTVSAMYEPKFSKSTAFNKNFGTTAGTVLEGRTFGTASGNNTGDFIQNQNASAQAANMWISGSGLFDSGITISGLNRGSGTTPLIFSDTNESLSERSWRFIQSQQAYGDFQLQQATTHLGSTFQSILRFNQTGEAFFNSAINAITAKLTNLTDGYLPYHISDASGLGNSPIYTDGTNNVGIGVIPTIPSGNTVNIELDGGNTIASRLYNTPQLYISSNAVGTGYSPIYKVDGYATQYQMQGFDGMHHFLTASSGIAGNAVSFIERMTITNVGNVGIGYSTGTEITNNKLAVNGSGYFNGAFSVQGESTLINIKANNLMFNSANKGIGFNRNVLNGDIFDISKGAFQIQHIDKTLEFQAYNGANLFNFQDKINTTSYLLNGVNLFSSLSNGFSSNWDGTKFVNGYNNSQQSLSGTNVTWNLANGKDAAITLTGNTVITLTNATQGLTGTLWVTNPSTVYTITFAGYANSIDPFIRLASNIVITSGGSKFDDYSFKYNGTKMNWNGTLDRQ